MTQKKLLILVLALWLGLVRLEFSVVDKDGKELETHKVDYGSRILVKSGGKSEARRPPSRVGSICNSNSDGNGWQGSLY